MDSSDSTSIQNDSDSTPLDQLNVTKSMPVEDPLRNNPPVPNSKNGKGLIYLLIFLIVLLVTTVIALISLLVVQNGKKTATTTQITLTITPSPTPTELPATTVPTMPKTSDVILIGDSCTAEGFQKNPLGNCLLVNADDKLAIIHTFAKCSNEEECIYNAQNLPMAVDFYLGSKTDDYQYILEDFIDDAMYTQLTVYAYNFKDNSVQMIDKIERDLLAFSGERTNRNCYDYYQDYAYSLECLVSENSVNTLKETMKPYLDFRSKYGAKRCEVKDYEDGGSTYTRFECPRS